MKTNKCPVSIDINQMSTTKAKCQDQQQNPDSEKDNAESSEVEFKPTAEIDLDDALHPGNMDWSFDKPSVPHTIVYIFNTD